MKTDGYSYTPCLRWKQGEYQAVMRLNEGTKAHLLPLVEVPEIGWDHETETDRKTIDEHLASFASRIAKKWGSARCLVDLKLLPPALAAQDSHHPVSHVFDLLVSLGCEAVPVVQLSSDSRFRSAVKAAASDNGMCLRVSLEEASSPTCGGEIDRLLSQVSMETDRCDLVLELGTPNFVPIEGFAKAIKMIIGRFPQLNCWRTFTLLGGSFPTSMAEIKESPSIVSRNEWLLYKLLVASLAESRQRIPLFGDYAVSHPAVLEVDMRLVKPAASIRYTIDDAWYVLKGANVRDHGFSQYQMLCRHIVGSPHYFGREYSWADEYIHGCATGSESTGNLTTWRCVGTNHHLTKVVDDLANLGALSNAA